MRKVIITVLLVSTCLLLCLSSSCNLIKSISTNDRDRLFNTEWRFIRDAPAGAEQPGYDDSRWMAVDLPHDWSIADLPGDDGPDQIGPFSKSSPGGRASGNVIGGTGCYRRHFTIDKADAGKRVILSFDGVYMETEVWVNGKSAGANKHGYSPFWFDITTLLNPAGESNVIAVKVANTGQNTRWYSGSGIYRNVYLTLTQPVHVAVWGAKVTATGITDNSADANVNVSLQNDGDKTADAVIDIKIKDPKGQLAGAAESRCKIDAQGNSVSDLMISVNKPSLWAVESPNLYQAEITISVNDKITDKYTQTFGIRSIGYSAEKGLLLNGKSIKLKGGCVHHDNGLLGAAAFDRAEERRVEIMKANGFNAIRCAHNPPSEAFLDACDRLGMLVIDEFTDMWESAKTPQDYSQFFKQWWKKDLANTVMRDRNHPSIIMWSIGNEVPERMDAGGVQIAKQLIATLKELDSTRPVTEAICVDFKGKSWDDSAPMFALLDISGYNYEWKQVESDHQKYPDRIIFLTESQPREAFESWKLVEKDSYFIGDFVWTAFDYLGEAGIGKSQYVSKDTPMESPFKIPEGAAPFPIEAMISFNSSWPWFGANCGDIDVTGEKKPQKAYRDVLWDISRLEMNVHTPVPEGQTEIVAAWGWPDERPSWNWKGNEGKPLQVRVFTKGDRVKLELNGEAVGEKDLKIDDRYIAVFNVPYQPGDLRATAFENGKEITVKTLKTTGKPAGIKLVADRSTIKADRNDLSFVSIEAIDEYGMVVPDAAIKVKIILTGNGEIAAAGNASPIDMESVNKPVIKTFHGKAQAVIRPFASAGTITLKAESEGLKEGVLEIEVK
jgi:beta-galactosidase